MIPISTPVPIPISIRFNPGDAVQVLDLGLSGHVRTPHYIRGKHGRVHELCGCFLNPEKLSVGDSSGPVVPLYRVSFSMADLWPADEHGPNDRLFIEIYDHWLALLTGTAA